MNRIPIKGYEVIYKDDADKQHNTFYPSRSLPIDLEAIGLSNCKVIAKSASSKILELKTEEVFELMSEKEREK